MARTSAARLAAIVAKKPLKEARAVLFQILENLLAIKASANTAFTGKSMSLSFEDVHFRCFTGKGPADFAESLFLQVFGG